MPALRVYELFICHAWDYSEDYDRLEQFLDDAPNFEWNNLSVPEHEAIDAQDEDLEYELRGQIRPAHAVLIPCGMYVARRERWIDWELRFARRIGRPIVGVVPWGALRVPRVIQKVAAEIVGWNGASIVQAIRRHALLE
jgi:hypothetical protein